METDEIWKPIEEFNGNYSISNLGNVRSEDRDCKSGRNRIHKGVPLKKQLDKYGYQYVVLDGVKRKVHRLVAQAFIPNPENKPTVNHKDEIKTNNFISNLDWMTVEEQNKYSLGKSIKIFINGEIKSYESVLQARKELYLDEGKIVSLHREYLRLMQICNNILTKGVYNYKNTVKVKDISECKHISEKKGKFIVRVTPPNEKRVYVGAYEALDIAIDARNNFIINNNLDFDLYEYRKEIDLEKDGIISNLDILNGMIDKTELTSKLLDDIRQQVINYKGWTSL